MRQTKFQQYNDAVVEKFVQMIDKAFVQNNMRFDQVLKDMRDEQMRILDDVGVNRNYKLAVHQTTFMYQAGIALSQSRTGKRWTSKTIAQFLYSNMVLTGLHPCPDVDKPKVERLIQEIRTRHAINYQI